MCEGYEALHNSIVAYARFRAERMRAMGIHFFTDEATRAADSIHCIWCRKQIFDCHCCRHDPYDVCGNCCPEIWED